MHRIEKLLLCIRLRWNRASGIEGHLSTWEKFGLILAESIRGLAHIMQRDLAVFMISRNDPRAKISFNVVRKEVPASPKYFLLIDSSFIVLKSLTWRRRLISSFSLCFVW